MKLSKAFVSPVARPSGSAADVDALAGGELSFSAKPIHSSRHGPKLDALVALLVEAKGMDQNKTYKHNGHMRACTFARTHVYLRAGALRFSNATNSRNESAGGCQDCGFRYGTDGTVCGTANDAPALRAVLGADGGTHRFRFRTARTVAAVCRRRAWMLGNSWTPQGRIVAAERAEHAAVVGGLVSDAATRPWGVILGNRSEVTR